MLYIAWVLTAAWLALAVLYPLVLHERLGITESPRLGETEDYLAGWFTPLAFGWFMLCLTKMGCAFSEAPRPLAS